MTEQLGLDLDPVLALLTPAQIYNAAGSELLKSLEEDRRIERKPPGIHLAELGEYFSMWANTAPHGGLIVIGMADGGEMIGLKEQPTKRINDLESAGTRYCSDARYESRRVPVINREGEADYVLFVRIRYHKNKVVRTSSNKAFMRVGEEKRRLSDSQVRDLENDKGEVDFELEPTRYEYPGEFDSQLVADYARAWRFERDVPDKPTVDVLRLSHLGEIIGGEFVPNTACALLFAKDPTKYFMGCKIRFLRFDGETEGTGEKWNSVKDITIDGDPIPRLIQRAEEVLEQQLRSFSRFNPVDGKFYAAPEYPKPAWYEALVNACVHRSYILRNMNIFIRMFDDRLVIESPGGFPAQVTPENIYTTQHSRNPRIMEALRRLSVSGSTLVKCANEGARRMRDTMVEMGLSAPLFEEKEGDSSIVRVTLKNNLHQRRFWVDAEVRQ